jgi:zinc transport system substrate-binding protein
MSPKVAKLQASAIEQALSKRFPELSMHFRANFDALIQELDALDQELQNALAHLKGTAFLVSHPAFGYFCQDYGLHQISVEHEGKDLRPKHLNYLLKTAHELHPTFGITLPQHNNKGAELIAKELNIPLKRIDPYSHDYFEMMRNLTYSIQEFAP